MRLIDADALLERADEVAFTGFQTVERKKHFMDLVSAMVESCTTIDAVPVVRCKDCKHYKAYSKPVEDFDGRCTARGCETDEPEFCSYGERRCDNEM